MVTVSVLYPKSSQSRFDYDYYLRKHTPLVRSRWADMGLAQVNMMRGETTPENGPPSFELIVLLTFTSPENLHAALAAFGSEIIADIANFTNVEPLIQVNHPVQN